MKIRFITGHPGHKAKAGDEISLADDKALDLIARRYAVPVKATTETATVKPSATAETAAKPKKK